MLFYRMSAFRKYCICFIYVWGFTSIFRPKMCEKKKSKNDSGSESVKGKLRIVVLQEKKGKDT